MVLEIALKGLTKISKIDERRYFFKYWKEPHQDGSKYLEWLKRTD